MRTQHLAVPFLATAILVCAGCGGGATSEDGSGSGMNLRITAASLASSPALPVKNNAVTIAVIVANNGTVATPATTFSFTMDGTTQSGNALPAIAAGATATVTCAVTSTTATTKSVSIALDPANTVNERSESDNTAAISITWDEASRRNIALSAVSVADASLDVGDTATLNFTLSKSGSDVLSGPAVLQTIAWRIVHEDDVSVVVKTGTSTFFNTSAALSTTFEDDDGLGGQGYIMQVDIDEDGESVDSDNSATFAITWTAPSAPG